MRFKKEQEGVDMKLIGASIMLPCRETWEVVEHGGIIVDSGVIKEVGNFDVLMQKYNNCDFVFYKNHVLLPAFINSHIHFEFSKNDTSFCYGDFDIWLDSVMANRGEVLKHNTQAIQQAIKTQKRSGVGSVCAISSYDLDLELLLDSKLKVIYCHEVLGAMESDFTQQALNISNRLEKTLALKSPTFAPALALHAPYSVNPKIAHYVVELAMRYNLLLSTHFLESRQELEWLNESKGYFKEFYAKNFQVKEAKAHFSIDSFLDLLGDAKTLFVHCLHADFSLKERLLKHGYIVSCPRSNLLLQGKMGLNHIIATDGKSSNADVDILEELRCALFATLSQEELSQQLIYAITRNSAKALGLNNGSLEEDKCADVALFKLPFNRLDNIAQSFILHARHATRLLVNGNDIL